MLGVILNRLNVTVIGFRWDMAVTVCSFMDGNCCYPGCDYLQKYGFSGG